MEINPQYSAVGSSFKINNMAEIENRRLVSISNRLPFQIVRENRKLSIRESDRGLVSALKSFFENQSTDKVFEKTLWIGSAEFNEQTWHKVNKKKLDQMSYQVEPLFIDKKIYSKYYNGFCNAT